MSTLLQTAVMIAALSAQNMQTTATGIVVDCPTPVQSVVCYNIGNQRFGFESDSDLKSGDHISLTITWKHVIEDTFSIQDIKINP